MVAGGVKEIAMNLRIYKSILCDICPALWCGRGDGLTLGDFLGSGIGPDVVWDAERGPGRKNRCAESHAE
jgi:hypothetical protein